MCVGEGACVCRGGGLVCVRGGGIMCVCVWDGGGRMVMERFTNLTFDNRSIILHGGQSSLST